MVQRPDVPGYPGLPELSGGHLVIPRPRPADSPLAFPPLAAHPPLGVSLPGSLGERLRAARDRAFVGRDRELAAFRAVLRDGGVLHLHGPGGIGKSTLLRRLADEARDAGRTVVEVDGRAVGVPPAGFTPAGSASAGSASAGFAPSGSAPAGSAPSGFTPAGSAPSGFTPAGSAPSGFTPAGSAPSGFTPA
ncbi:AAA family ATPase, partial [Catenuloplanes sp. NPDC051500]|uniref:ATP-binding protein n=1 Tax=Catenuloplanes sp. NPDC051500 TaxID=3363959 RepID=UPI003799C3AD